MLDVDRYELTREGKPVRMERIPMDLLILLVREKGRLVSREEIIERLWGKNLYFDSDNSINTAVRKIRNSSGDSSGIRLTVPSLPSCTSRRASECIQSPPGRTSADRT